jgi:hypothetical protein
MNPLPDTEYEIASGFRGYRIIKWFWDNNNIYRYNYLDKNGNWTREHCHYNSKRYAISIFKKYLPKTKFFIK